MDDPRRARLVATLGPASLERAAALAASGADAFRLNASHMAPEAVAGAVRGLRDAGLDLPVVVDLQGAKMRLGPLPERGVAAGERLVFALEPGRPGEIPLPHPELFAAVAPGDTLALDDDRLRVRVLERGPGALVGEALGAAMLRPRKGVNLVDHPVRLADLVPADARTVALLDGIPGIAFAVSFMRDGSEADWIRRRQPGRAVIGKVERREAIDALAAIAAATDEVWICRGDLGAQLGPAGLARAVAGIEPAGLPVPVLMAGQVLEHLTEHSEPTRSEVCHAWDLLRRGYAGIVLSDETAIGRDPRRAVAIARSLLDAR